MEITLKINKKLYPEIFKLKKSNINNHIKKIFKLGYDTMYPNINNKIGYNILSAIQNISKSDNDETNEKLEFIAMSLDRLIGLGNNSSKKGELAENILELQFQQRYGDIKYEDKSKTPHSGDAWIYFPNNKVVMLESKNYTKTVIKDEVEKMERDMIENNMKLGMFLSWNSGVQGMREFDIHSFNHHGDNYNMIIISNLTKDMSRLDLGVQLIRKMVIEQNKFPWIVSKIQQDLSEMDKIIKTNYILRDCYKNTMDSINHNLYEFGHKLREYQSSLEDIGNKIISNIDSTMKHSLGIQLNKDILKKYKGKKVDNILIKLLDLFKKNKCDLDDNLLVFKNKKDIGNIKIMNKKILVSFHKGQFSTILKEGKDHSENVLESLGDIQWKLNKI